MCTAISFNCGDHYFGRNLDLEHYYMESVTVTPRNYEFHFHCAEPLFKHYAIIGMASVIDGYPLYYDATNEHGLSMAGLNFPGNATYFPQQKDRLNLAPYELIPWILGKYKTVEELRTVLDILNITAIPFSSALPLSPLHWIVSDKHESIVLESTANGLQIYNNPVNVLTNNPPFPFHLQNLSNYLNLTALEPVNRFSSTLNLPVYSRGMGGIGLPGDLSSASRFIRAAFTLHNSTTEESETNSVSQFFHILDTVAQTSGCVRIGNEYEKTLYTSCCNTTKGIYYYKTYYNSTVTAIRMNHCNLETSELSCFPLQREANFLYEN